MHPMDIETVVNKDLCDEQPVMNVGEQYELSGCECRCGAYIHYADECSPGLQMEEYGRSTMHT